MDEVKNTQSIVKLSNSITASFASLKAITFGAIIIAAVTAVVCVYLTARTANEHNRQIYILNEKGQIFAASSQDEGISREAEVRDQIQRFHELFFNLPSNPEIINANLNRAMEMSDRSAYRYYNTIQEKGFYKDLSNSGASQQLIVDSIRVNMSRPPYPALVYCSRFITRESSITRYNMVTSCKVMEVQRNSKNLHGLQIEQFDVIEDNKVGVRRR